MRKITTAFVVAVGITIGGTVTNDEPSINNYFDPQVGDQYCWTSYGCWFNVYETHRAWPEKKIDAEWRFVPLGFLCSVFMNSIIIGCAWFIAWRVALSIGGQSGAKPPSQAATSNATS